MLSLNIRSLFLVVFLLSALSSALPFGLPTQTLALSSAARGLGRDLVAPVSSSLRQIDILPTIRPPVAPMVAKDIKPSYMMARSKPSKPATPSALAASLDHSVESILLPFDTKAEKQGQVGACHIFATTQVLYNLFNEATDKVLHTNSFFADHLTDPKRFGLRQKANTKDFLLEHHLGSIERLRATHGGRVCRDDLGLEGGFFDRDLRLLQNVGSLLVDKNSEWRFMDSAVRNIDHERQMLVMAKTEVDADVAKKRLGDAGFDYIFSKSVHTPEMTDLVKADREIVRQVVSGLKPITITMANAYGKMPMTKALQKSKKDIIDMLHQYGTSV